MTKCACGKDASYGFELKKAISCAKCKDVGMVNVKDPRCTYDGCTTVPHFNKPGLRRGVRCAKHKEEGMVNVKVKRCEEEGCITVCTYNLPGLKVGKYCKTHAKEGMVDVKNKRCAHEGCMKSPTFNVPGTQVKKYCKAHKSEDMVSVCKHTCEHTSCNVMPFYNYPEIRKGRFCTKHKLEGMIDIYTRRCSADGCMTYPAYNHPEMNNPERCKSHKEPGMIIVKYKRCLFEGCTKVPGFGPPDSGEVMFCRSHSTQDMTDNKTKSCENEKCKLKASYGPLFGPKKHCKRHSTPNEYLMNNPKCEVSGCKVKPFWSDTNYPKACEEHASEEYTNIVEKPCSLCGLDSFINEGSSGMCNDCSDFTVRKVHKSKESHIKDVLDANGIHYDSADNVVAGGCSKYRPDFIIDCGVFTVVLEVDENQHKSYACECEISRMIQLHQDFGGTPIVFLRYNPDSYRDASGATRRGGVRNPTREKVLIDVIKRLQAKTEWEYTLAVTYLYYDGFNGTIEFTDIDYFDHSMSDIAETITNA